LGDGDLLEPLGDLKSFRPLDVRLLTLLLPGDERLIPLNRRRLDGEVALDLRFLNGALLLDLELLALPRPLRGNVGNVPSWLAVASARLRSKARICSRVCTSC